MAAVVLVGAAFISAGPVASAAVVSAQPGAALVDTCTPSFQNDVIPQWGTVAPQGPSGGITLCVGTTVGIPGNDAFVQIVDLSAGAKVRMWADLCPLGQCSGGDDKYLVRTAPDWANWIGLNTITPNADRLYSVSNAGHFSTLSGEPTRLSLPFFQLRLNEGGIPGNGGFALVDDGGALNNTTDPAWDSPKRAITFGDTLTTPQGPVQEVHMFDFPTHYTHDDVASPPFEPAQITCGSTCPDWDATVGFTPDRDDDTGPARRTYVGVSPTGGDAITKVYILNTAIDVTVGQAQNILKSFGSQLELQLDGGTSTQLWGNGGAHLIDAPIVREVPQGLAVYGS
jgi:hypothetical protein